MKLPKYDAKIFFAYRIGELQFKENRRGEFTKKFGNTRCFADGCSEPDTLQHTMVCDGYDQLFRKNNQDYDPDVQLEFIEYLKQLDKERHRKYSLPVLFRKSLKDEIKV